MYQHYIEIKVITRRKNVKEYAKLETKQFTVGEAKAAIERLAKANEEVLNQWYGQQLSEQSDQ
jgi:Holliday junction resolvasome RuvABC endonuclease subunit